MGADRRARWLTRFGAAAVAGQLLLVLASGARAQNAGPPPAGTPTPATPTSAPAPAAGTTGKAPTLPSIAKLTVIRNGTPKDPPLEFRMGDSISLGLSAGGFGALTAAVAANGKTLGLFINGHFLAGLVPLVTGPDEIAFKPIRNDANQAFWNELWSGRLLDQRQLSVAVGAEDASVIVRSGNNLTMDPLSGPGAFFLVVGAAAILIATVLLALKSTMLRDGARIDAKTLPTYSLGRTQMAFWFVNVVLAVLFIWAVTGSVPPITPSVLGLLGIGAGTALGAALVDQGSNGKMPNASAGFIEDILSDSGTIAFHRFQMVVWTVVLSVIFWGAIYGRLALPDFDTTLLALMGIGAGTYLGFKFPENQAPSPGPARATPPAARLTAPAVAAQAPTPAPIPNPTPTP